jgi:DNA-binding HxlR family transcriptional regulator
LEAEVHWSAEGKRKQVRAGCDHPCPIERGMRLIGGKWKGSILWHLREGPVRFNDLDRMLSGASKKMLAQRLKEMEVDGLLTRQVISDRPVAVAYEITPFGRSALGVLGQLAAWSEAQSPVAVE